MERRKEEEMEMLFDLSVFPNLAAMLEAERCIKRKKKKGNVSTKDTGICSSNKEEKDTKTRKPKMRLERKRTREEELKVLSDLSIFPNLSAMLEAERSKKKTKSRRNKKKENDAMENTGESVVSLSSKEENDAKTKKPKMRLERKRTKEEEMKVLSDLSVFQNLADMLAAEKFMKKKKRRRKKKQNVQVGHQKDAAKASNCFVYKRSQHTGSWPEKNQGNCPSSKICLRCGTSGHDMFSCRNQYSSDDLKEIQCHLCKRFGHLCCVDFPDDGKINEVSCYKCGHSGHLGSECTKWHVDIGNLM